MKSTRQPSWILSTISLAFIVVVTMLVVDWHSGGIFSTSTSFSHNRRRRRMQTSIKMVDSTVGDDETRDDRCREYLVNFLNGTTDEKDECDGMKNAYQAADCEDSNSILPFIRKHHHHNGANDDVMIDDFFEAWQCCSSIYSYYSKHCNRPELASFKLLGIVAVLVLCGLVMSLLKTFRVQWVPDAAACILVGATVGGVVRFVYPSGTSSYLGCYLFVGSRVSPHHLVSTFF